MANLTSPATHRSAPTRVQQPQSSTDSAAHRGQLFDLAVAHSGLSYWTLDPESDDLYLSPEWTSQLGYETGELGVAEGLWRKLMHPDDLEVLSAKWKQFVNSGTHVELEYRLRHKDGSYRRMLARISMNRRHDGEPSGVFGSHWDVTEHTDAQEKLRSLAVQLADSKLEEQRRLSRELHDYLAQILVACTMKIQAMDQSGISDINASMLREVIGLIKQADDYTRTLIAKLSPDLLYNLGLLPALDRLATEIEGQYSVDVEVLFRGLTITLPTETALFVFETVRELLNNVVRHARSERAKVDLKHDGDQLQVTVGDHGIGFEMTRLVDAHHDKHFGLFSIKQGLRARNGSIDIQSTIGEGSRISFTLPLLGTPADESGVIVANLR
jgi:PAS domain S-box-containing protein